MRAALKALSYPDIDIKKTYRLERQLHELAGKPLLFYKPWDHTVRLDGHEVPVRVFEPKQHAARGVLLFFHGGGWVLGNIDSYTKTCIHLARLTARTVISVDYRLAPEHPFPAGLEDCYAVARALFLECESTGVGHRHITLIGDSAGANLAAAVSLMARDRREFLPARQILLYPATAADHTPGSPFASVRENGAGYLLTSKRICDYMDLYASGPDDFCNPYFSPLEAADFSNQPSTMVITAQYDPLRDEGEAYGEKLREAGCYVELHRLSGALHGFFSLPPRFDHVKRAYAYINRFLSEVNNL